MSEDQEASAAPELEEGVDAETGADVNSSGPSTSLPTTAVSGRDDYVAALLREREGYVRYAKKDRVKAVNAELKRIGYSEEFTTDEHETETPEPRRRRGR